MVAPLAAVATSTVATTRSAGVSAKLQGPPSWMQAATPAAQAVSWEELHLAEEALVAEAAQHKAQVL